MRSKGRFECFVVFLLSFAWFLWNAAPFLTVGDSGELAGAGAILGVAHSPGYPLLSLLGKAANVRLPGCPAFRMNALSALCMAGAAVILWKIWRTALHAGAQRQSQDYPSGAFSCFIGLALLLGSASFLDAATQTEVFALLLLGACAIAALVLDSRYTLAAFLSGLMLGNHHTLLLAAPACFIAAFFNERRRAGMPIERGRRAALIAAAFALGLTVYFYLPIAASRSPGLNWGKPDNPERFWRVVTRKDYGSFSLTIEGGVEHGMSSYYRQIERMARFYAESPADAALALFGLGGAILAVINPVRRTLGLLALAGFFTAGPFFLWLGNPPFDAQTTGALERFYLLPLALLAMTAPVFLEKVINVINVIGVKKGFRIVFRLALITFIAFTTFFTFPRFSRRHNYLMYDYGRNLLRSITPGAYFFMEGGDDTMYAMAYWIFAERRRPDLGDSAKPETLRARDRAGLVFPGIYGFDFRTTPRDVKKRLRDEFETKLAQKETLFYQTLRLDLVNPSQLLPIGIVQLRAAIKGPNTPAAPFPSPVSILPPPVHWRFYSMRGLDGWARPHYRERALIPYYYYTRGQTVASFPEDYGEALRDFRVAFLKGGDALWVNNALGREAGEWGEKAAAKGRYDYALGLFTLASRVIPKEPSYAVNTCVLKEKTGKLSEALDCYEAAEPRFPDDGGLYKNWGATLLSAKRTGEAKAKFHRYFELSRDPSALSWIEKLHE